MALPSLLLLMLLMLLTMIFLILLADGNFWIFHLWNSFRKGIYSIKITIVYRTLHKEAIKKMNEFLIW